MLSSTWLRAGDTPQLLVLCWLVPVDLCEYPVQRNLVSQSESLALAATREAAAGAERNMHHSCNSIITLRRELESLKKDEEIGRVREGAAAHVRQRIACPTARPVPACSSRPRQRLFVAAARERQLFHCMCRPLWSLFQMP